MKKFLLKSMLLLCALIVGVGSVWAADVVETLTIKGWGSYTTNGYSSAGTDYTGTGSKSGVTYAMQVFNGSKGFPRGNQNSANANFSCRNTTTYSDYYIKQIKLIRGSNTGTFDGSTSDRSVVYFGTSAYANPNTTAPSGTSTASTENASGQSTLTWDNSDKTKTYFILYNLKTSNTVEDCTMQITWGSTSTDPEINATNVEYDADETDGEIAYTIDNPVDGKSLTASTSADWITLGTVTSTKVPFTMTENTGVLREGTITLTYQYGEGADDKISKDITVTQKAPVAKYNVIISDMTNGSVTADVAKAVEDATVTLTISPASGYKLATITATDADDNDVTLSGTGNTRTFTMPAKAVTISATFEIDYTTTYDFSFESMGSSGWGGSYATHTQEFTGATVKFSSASKQSGTITDIPTTKGSSTLGAKYVSLVLTEANATLKSASFALRHWTNKDVTVTMYYSADGGENWTTTGQAHAFTSSTNGEDVTLTASSLPTGTNAVKIEGGADHQYGVASATVEINTNININALCNDGVGNYYGTYSSGMSFFVPSGLTVSAVSVSNGKLVITNYSENDIVKANTGVMVSSETAGDKTITLSAETGTEKDGNMLKASSVAMDAENTKFYRLTMHNDTQIGFWWGAAEGAAFSLGANKAYLAVPTTDASSPLRLWFEDEENNATSIEEIKTAEDTLKFIENGQLFIKKDGITYDVLGRIVK